MWIFSHTLEVFFTINQEEVDEANWYEKEDALNHIRVGSIAYRLVEEYISK